MSREPETLAALLKNKSEFDFKADQLSSKAHWRWDRDQFFEAAVLFDAAWRVAQQNRSRQGFSFRIRSGICFRLAGEIERAWPILIEATEFDWSAAGLGLDSHMSEWAFIQMLLVHHQKEDVESFRRIFSQAIERSSELDRAFPFIYPHQDQLLQWCSEFELREQFEHVAEQALAVRGNSRKLKKLIEQLRRSWPE